jgi:hypothetical protein
MLSCNRCFVGRNELSAPVTSKIIQSGRRPYESSIPNYDLIVSSTNGYNSKRPQKKLCLSGIAILKSTSTTFQTADISINAKRFFDKLRFRAKIFDWFILRSLTVGETWARLLLQIDSNLEGTCPFKLLFKAKLGGPRGFYLVEICRQPGVLFMLAFKSC